MKDVLILGNGISRLSHDDVIRSWPGEVWGCNRVFYEYGRILSRLAGHADVMVEAREHRRQSKHEYEIWGGHLGKAEPAERRFTCEKKYQNDTGSTLVAQALTEGYSVKVCGFDIGGPDILSPGHEKFFKWKWVDRWRDILRDFGSDRIEFIGHDHLPFLLSRRPATEYSRSYIAGKPHIADPEYLQVWQQWSGRPLPGLPEVLELVKVRYKDGRESELQEPIAIKMQAKGKVEIIKPEKKQTQATASRTPKKEKVKDDAPVSDN